MSRALPPLNSIRAFECAARHLSFAKAASELGVTQSAVSKQVAILEDHTGFLLFERHRDGLSLTLEGRELQQSVSPSFQQLSRSFVRLSRRAPGSRTLRMSTVASFASEFLVPRLSQFESAHPDLELGILTSDRVYDLAREDIDLSIRYGPGGWSDAVSRQLSSSLLLPVVSPDLLKRSGGDIQRLVQSQRRIQIFMQDEWLDWTNSTGIEIDTSSAPYVMEHFLVALRAVALGQGIAILPEILVRDHIANGKMVSFSPALDWDQAFHLVHRPGAEKAPETRRVIDWLFDSV